MEKNHLANKHIRAKYNMPTTESKIYAVELCEIHRWYTTLSSTYLNNQNEYVIDINYLNNQVLNLQNITKKECSYETLNQREQERLTELKNMCKKENMNKYEDKYIKVKYQLIR